MPTLSFFPWMNVREPLAFGDFRIVPCAHAIAAGMIPSQLHDAVTATLEPYGKTRGVDRRAVPLLHHVEISITAELSDEQVYEYYEFRQRVAFSILAARTFFGLRYASSDNARLVIQAFTPEHAGATVIQSRRRDGATNNIIPKGRFTAPRPEHVPGWCSIPQDLDTSLLTALELAAASDLESWPRIAEAMRLFVGANTDSPDVSMHHHFRNGFGRCVR